MVLVVGGNCLHSRIIRMVNEIVTIQELREFIDLTFVESTMEDAPDPVWGKQLHLLF